MFRQTAIDLGVSQSEGNSASYQLWAYSFIEFSMWYKPRDPAPFRDSIWLAAFPTGSNAQLDYQKELEVKRQASIVGQVVCYRKSDSTPGPVKVQSIPPIFNPAITKAWVEICKAHHQHSCGIGSSPNVQGFKLINCSTKTVVPASSPIPPYVALSYTWGAALRSSPVATNTTTSMLCTTRHTTSD
jgi:hypothetical protein